MADLQTSLCAVIVLKEELKMQLIDYLLNSEEIDITHLGSKFTTLLNVYQIIQTTKTILSTLTTQGEIENEQTN